MLRDDGMQTSRKFTNCLCTRSSLNTTWEIHSAHCANDSSSIESMSKSANFSPIDITDLLLVASVSDETCLFELAHSSVATATKQLSRWRCPVADRISLNFSGKLGEESSDSIPISLRKLRSRSSPSGY